MKRFLFLLFIAFLVSCNNQQEKNTTEETINTEPEAAIKVEFDSSNQGNPNIVLVEPKRELEPTKMEAEGQVERNISSIFRQGTGAYENGDYAGGVELFKRVLEEDPQNIKAYYNLGVGYFNLDKFHDALQAFNNAISIFPEDTLSLQFRGRVYYMLEDFKSSLADYSKVIEMKPSAMAYYNRGTTLGRTKNYLEAIKDFDKAIEFDPEYAEAYFNRGLANYYQGRLHDACYDWRKAHEFGHYEADKAIRAYCETGQDK